MNTIRITSRQAAVAFLLVILLVGAGIAFFQIQKQQELRGRASTYHWLTTQSAVTSCSSQGTALINVTFKNLESTRSINVTAKDNASSQSADLGTIMPGKSGSGIINTNLTGLKGGTVVFSMTWTDNQGQNDTVNATYPPIDYCPAQPSYCTDLSVSACLWDELPGATKYNVTIVNTTDDKIIESKTVSASATKLEFPSISGKTYQCSVSAVNECSTGDTTKSQPLTCIPPLTPTPTLLPSASKR